MNLRVVAVALPLLVTSNAYSQQDVLFPKLADSWELTAYFHAHDARHETEDARAAYYVARYFWGEASARTTEVLEQAGFHLRHWEDDPITNRVEIIRGIANIVQSHAQEIDEQYERANMASAQATYHAVAAQRAASNAGAERGEWASTQASKALVHQKEAENWVEEIARAAAGSQLLSDRAMSVAAAAETRDRDHLLATLSDSDDSPSQP